MTASETGPEPTPPSTPDPATPDPAGPGPATPVAVSEEQLATLPSGLELCYQTFGDPGDEPLLLVMGLAGPMTWWREPLCEMFARAGFFVIRYDNRDVGRSSRSTGDVEFSLLARAFVGMRVRTPYTIADLAGDALDLLDHLGIASAHLCGVSMGGMISQTVAIEHPERVRSLTSIMSNTGRRWVGGQDPTLLPHLIAPRAKDRAGHIAQSIATWDRIGSPAYPESREEHERRAGETYDRGISEIGVMRQMVAVVAQPDRTAALRRLDVPTTVIHGDADRLVNVSGGRATADAIPGAELVLVAGMGHDLSSALYPTFVDGVRRAADRAAARSTDRTGDPAGDPAGDPGAPR